MFSLRYATTPDWTKTVLENFDAFLIDHAAAEKKASGMAISMLSHYPDRPELVSAMVDLSIEEMTHFREVIKILTKRGLILGPDTKDQYVANMRSLMRKGSEKYFLDRLIIAGVIEARGCERFGLVADALVDEELKKFYRAITESEARHENLFIRLSHIYFEKSVVEKRLNDVLEAEAQFCADLPIVPALH